MTDGGILKSRGVHTERIRNIGGFRAAGTFDILGISPFAVGGIEVENLFVFVSKEIRL